MAKWVREMTHMSCSQKQNPNETFLQCGEGKKENMDGKEQKRLRIVIHAAALSLLVWSN